MESSNRFVFKDIVYLIRPWTLLSALLFYGLGMGFVVYMEKPLNWGTAALGLALVFLLFISSAVLKAVHDLPVQGRPYSIEGHPALTRPRLLVIAVSLLTAGALLAVMLAVRGAASFVVLLFLGIGFFLAFFYGSPPLRLVTSGYGELAMAVLLANIAPTLAFVLQTGEVHQLLAMITFPLTALWLALQLAFGLEKYWMDTESGRRVLLVRLGWERGMNLHNYLILAAFLLILIARAMGLTWSLTWPGLLTLPIGLFQIWQMWQISQGAKPHWKLLRLTAAATAVLTAYFFAIALWTV